MEGKLLIFCAPSGSGKSTIVQHLVKLKLGLAFSISATSRAPRKGEAHGREYYFISLQQFKDRIEHDEFIEWEEVYPDQFYGTLKSEVERIWEEGQHAIFDIDVQGGLNLKKTYGEKALAIFVKPPSLEILEQRLRTRGTDTETAIRERIGKAEFELGFAHRFDRILVNDNLEKALGKAEVMVSEFLKKRI